MPYASIPVSVQTFMDHITDLCGQEHANWAEDFNAGFANTLLATVKRRQDDTTFLLTGDIPAMWLRDSAAQMRPYLVIAEHDPDLADMIEGLVRQQFRYIAIDPLCQCLQRGGQRQLLGSRRSIRFFQPMAVGAQI